MATVGQVYTEEVSGGPKEVAIGQTHIDFNPELENKLTNATEA